MILPRFDFTSFVGTPYLNFKWAYAKSDPSYSDELIVLVSKDCGVNWTQVFYRTGTAMTTGTTQTTPYIPTASTVWKIANISLATYTTYPNVLIKIVNVTDGGNNLYIDNINLGANVTGINEVENRISDIVIYPNPSNGAFSIEYTLLKDSDVSIIITDILGRAILTTETKSQSVGLHKHDINSVLENGIYNVSIKTADILINKKIVITK